MKHNKLLLEKVYESVTSVLPITAIVLFLSITIAPLDTATLAMFLFGALLLIFGMGLFTLGVDMSMIPLGEGIGARISKSKGYTFPLLIILILGLIVTIAEPDLQVLAQQVPAISNMTLILTVGIGVGFFLMLSQLRMLLRIPLSVVLWVFYGLIFILMCFTPGNMIAVSFDSGGVTTGPITVPFIMALGIGLVSVRSDKNSSNDSFGLIALSSIGPILSVMILGLIFRPQEATQQLSQLIPLTTTKEVAGQFWNGFPHYIRDVAIAVFPIVVIFFLFQTMFHRFKNRQLLRSVSGFLYTYLGLVLFLTGVNVGFMPAGQTIGASLATGDQKWLLIPVGMLIGYFIVKAEPAVVVLTNQVEEITGGSISKRSIVLSLSIAVAFSVGLSMLRILLSIPILWFLLPGYFIALAMTFFVPHIFTGIAFDSGGVASGPMTATFLLPLAMGACQAMGGDIMKDAFGIVAMVAMTPLFTIQTLGLYSKMKQNSARKRLRLQLQEIEDGILFFD
ncbi:MAG: DUF1538 domain-containing protein [Clostridium sp.]|jgi:hypothetical protein|nr:DUF1538 domain-containing protein [Clostridium sp.]